MPTNIGVEELESQYFEILKRVCQGESFTVVADGRALAEIRPSAKRRRSKETIKIFEELSSPRYASASDDEIRELLGEKPA
jgi:antitoxin (DNA-binding transcriptional repressor) of toxin-antitoxin stability system